MKTVALNFETQQCPRKIIFLYFPELRLAEQSFLAETEKCEYVERKMYSIMFKIPCPVSDEAEADHRKIMYQLNTCLRRPTCTRTGSRTDHP